MEKILSLMPKSAFTSIESLIKMRYYIVPSQSHGKAFSKNITGNITTEHLGQGIEYAQVRPYTASDDSRYIDWRVSARRQITHTREYHQEKDNVLTILLDQSISMFFGSQYCFKSVFSANLTALLGWKAAYEKFPVGGLVFNQDKNSYFTGARGEKHFSQFLNEIVHYNKQLSIDQLNENSIEKTKQQFKQALALLAKRKNQGTLEIISDFCFWDEEVEKHLAMVASVHTGSLHWVIDKMEKSLPIQSGILHFFDGKNILQVNTENIQHSDQWQKRFLEKYETISLFCQRNHWRFQLHCIEENL